MYTKSPAVALFSLICFAVAAPQGARAEVIENVFELGTSDLLGTIAFPSITGDSPAGVVLSYDSFTAADITSVSWTLDPTTDDVLAINLSALQGDADCKFGSNCSNSTLDLSLTNAQEGSLSCSSNGDISQCLLTETLTPIRYVPTSVPELSSWAMMLLGFAGFSYIGHRRIRARRTA